jgi:hypothetical protein
MEDRLSELREKEELTHAEMLELVRLSPVGTFGTAPNALTLGVTDLSQFVYNFREGPERSKKAFEAGCYMEVLSLRLQHIELWLRMFWVVRNKGRRIFESTDKRSFGVILKDCADIGLEPDLCARLERFNQSRINAIHKYLLGATDYDAMKDTCVENKGLDVDVQKWVMKEIGVPWVAHNEG